MKKKKSWKEGHCERTIANAGQRNGSWPSLVGSSLPLLSRDKDHTYPIHRPNPTDSHGCQHCQGGETCYQGIERENTPKFGSLSGTTVNEGRGGRSHKEDNPTRPWSSTYLQHESRSGSPILHLESFLTHHCFVTLPCIADEWTDIRLTTIVCPQGQRQDTSPTTLTDRLIAS